MRDRVSMLHWEAKRRPDLAALINKEKLTMDDIDNFNAPLPWFKEALRDLLKNPKKALTANQIQEIEKNVIRGTVPDPVGKVARWYGGAKYIDVNGQSSVEVRTNDYIWCDPMGTYWIDTVKCATKPREFATLSWQDCTKTSYYAMVQSNIAERYGLAFQGASHSRGSNQLFTIRRVP